MSSEYPLESCIEAKPHDFYGFKSKGIFAKEFIPEGTVLWRYKENEELTTYTRAQVLDEQDDEKRNKLINFSYMVDFDKYGSTLDGENDPGYYWNHSCDPNCGYLDDEHLVAIRDIQKGEHVVYDYAFTELPSSFHAGLTCKCGTDKCRGVLDFLQFRDQVYVEEYGQWMMSHVKKLTNECGFFHPNIHKCAFFDGFGLFTFKPIKKGEVCIVFAGKLVNKQQLMILKGKRQTLSLQVNDDLWQILSRHTDGETGDHINHSCEPNCVMEDSTTVVALRDLEADEQLFIDYGTVNGGCDDIETDYFTCECGTKTCRGKVTPQDWLNIDFQKKFEGCFPPFMTKKIKTMAALMETSQTVVKSPTDIIS